MRSVAGVVVLLVLIAAVAVTGSQAQPLPRINPILGSCQQQGPVALESLRCRPVALLAAPAELERDFVADIGGNLANEAGGFGADPDNIVTAAVRPVWEVFWRAAVAATSVNLVQRAMDWAFGDVGPMDPPILEHVDPSIFDPVE